MPSGSARPVHRVRTSECGRARRGDEFTGDPQKVTCDECLLQSMSPWWKCFQCGKRAGSGKCITLKIGATIHESCYELFKRIQRGRRLLQTDPDLFTPVTCKRCGRVGVDHGPGAPGCRQGPP